jgi:hypothetical protein
VGARGVGQFYMVQGVPSHDVRGHFVRSESIAVT